MKRPDVVVVDIPDLVAVTIEVNELISSGEARRRRERAGLSLEKSAASMYVSTATVSRWEKKERHPQGRNAIAYYEFLARLAAREAI